MVRNVALLLAVALLLLSAPSYAASMVAEPVASGAACSGSPAAATLVFNLSCSAFGFHGECFIPNRRPNSSDVLVFPRGSNATHTPPEHGTYDWVEIGTIIVEDGALVTMEGGALVVRECLQVYGALSLIDTGRTQSPFQPFPRDPSVPMHTDCYALQDGFAPRVCGPGMLYVTGKVTLYSEFSSLWTSGTVAVGGELMFASNTFLWGNVTNEGTVSSTGLLYFHGALTNAVGALAQFVQLRPDVWTTGPDPTTPPILSLINNGNMTFSSLTKHHADYYFYDYDVMSTKDDNLTPTVALAVFNKGRIQIVGVQPDNDVMFGGIEVRFFNYGTLQFGPMYLYWGTGSTVNYGIVIADQATVHLQDYLSHDGTLETKNGGQFHFGPTAGVDTKTAVVCEKQKVTPDAPAVRRRVVADTDLRASNASCDSLRPCPGSLCCGKDGFCQATQCQNADGYGGGAFCCEDNAPCGGSSHGPYCGAGIFGWEVDAACMDGLEFVDRYEFEAMKRRFHVDLPKFGTKRYTFRGQNNRIQGDGTGRGVVFTEPMELRGDLLVREGGALQCLIDSGSEPFVGPGGLLVDAGGRFGAGIKTTLGAASRISVATGGVLDVPSYATLRVDRANANVHVATGAVVQLDGRVFVVEPTKGQQLMKSPVHKKAGGFLNCGTTRGSGAIVEENPAASRGDALRC